MVSSWKFSGAAGQVADKDPAENDSETSYTDLMRTARWGARNRVEASRVRDPRPAESSAAAARATGVGDGPVPATSEVHDWERGRAGEQRTSWRGPKVAFFGTRPPCRSSFCFLLTVKIKIFHKRIKTFHANFSWETGNTKNTWVWLFEGGNPTENQVSEYLIYYIRILSFF